MSDKLECPDCGFGLIVLFNDDVGLCIGLRQGVGLWCRWRWVMEPQCEGCGNRCVELFPQGVHLLCAVCLEVW